jgi:tetratricopeptide (TPR) repeat protein
MYALSCWLLFILLCRLFRNQTGYGGLLFPFICGLLYTAHPIHTEVVNNIKSMDEILCFMFAIGSLLMLIKWLGDNKIPSLVFAIILYFLSLMSKETGVVFLVLIPLTLFVFIIKENKKLLKVSLIVAAVTMAYVIMRFQILVHTETEGHLGIMDNSLMAANDGTTYFASATFILFKYILLLILPHPLSYDYSFAQVPLKTIGDPVALFSILLYLFLGVFAILKIKNKNLYAFAILFFLISLFPVSNIYLKLASTMAERFLFIPSLGYCIILSLLLVKLTNNASNKIKFTSIKQMVSRNTLLFTIIFGIITLYSIKIFSRNPNWKDNNTLFAHDAEIADNSARAHYNYGCILLDEILVNENNPTLKNGVIDHAINELNKAIAINPKYPEVYSFLSTAYIKKEDYKNALIYQEKYDLYHTSPDNSIHKNLGFLYQKTNLYDKALAEFDTVLKYEPKYYSAFINKGEIYGLKNMFNESNNEFLKAMNADPKAVTPYVDIGVNYGNAKMFDKAMEYFKKGEAIDPNSEDNCRMMGYTYNMIGDSIKGKEYLDKAALIHSKKAK